jgi:hypothetical protein
VTGFRSYYVSSGTISISGTALQPVLYGTTSSIADCDITAIRSSIASGGTPSPPNNSSVLVQVALVTGTVGAGVTSTPSNNGPSVLAANTTFQAGTLTSLTQSTILYTIDMPFIAGQPWVEWLPSGFEKNIPAGNKFAVSYQAPSGAGSGMTFRTTLEFSE